MKIVENDILLRVFLSEKSKHMGRPVYELIVLKAKELKIAGATVLRGILGYGASAHLHSSRLVNLSDNLPLVIEIIDSEENIELIMPYIDKIVEDGFVTLEKVNVIKYRHK